MAAELITSPTTAWKPRYEGLRVTREEYLDLPEDGFKYDMIDGVPDLVCEVLSPTTRKRDLGVKAERYQKCGVKEYWIANPEAKTMEIWYNQKDNWEKFSPTEEFISRVLTGLTIKRQEVFA